MGRYFTCNDCGETSKDELSCSCGIQRVKNLIALKCGAVILETLYDDVDYPFVYLLEKLKLANGNLACLKTYIGSAGGMAPEIPITSMLLAQFEEKKVTLQQRDAEDELSENENVESVELLEPGSGLQYSDFYTFTVLNRKGKTRRGIFEKVPLGQEETVDRCFPESQLAEEKEKLIRSGWKLEEETSVWNKVNANHKKELKAVKKQVAKDDERRLFQDTGVFYMDQAGDFHTRPQKQSSGPTVCGYKVGPPIVCTANKTHPDGLCSAHARVQANSTQ